MSGDTDAAPSATQDFIGGLLSIAFGGFVLWEASTYPMGTLFRMGPGFFPTVLGALIVVLGVALGLHGFKARTTLPIIDISLRPALMIPIAVSAFALSLERFGLAPATVALVLLSSLADSGWRLGRSLILAGAMALAVYVVFIVVLQMPFSVVTW